MPASLDDELTKLMNTYFLRYWPDYSHTVEETYWANHCAACGALQGDFYLHTQAGVAFFPVTEEEIRQLTLITVRTDFDVMLNSGTAWGSNADDIFRYAQRMDFEQFVQKHKEKRLNCGLAERKHDKPPLWAIALI